MFQCSWSRLNIHFVQVLSWNSFDNRFVQILFLLTVACNKCWQYWTSRNLIRMIVFPYLVCGIASKRGSLLSVSCSKVIPANYLLRSCFYYLFLKIDYFYWYNTLFDFSQTAIVSLGRLELWREIAEWVLKISISPTPSSLSLIGPQKYTLSIGIFGDMDIFSIYECVEGMSLSCAVLVFEGHYYGLDPSSIPWSCIPLLPSIFNSCH